MAVSKCKRRALCSTQRLIQRAPSTPRISLQLRIQQPADRQFSSQVQQKLQWLARRRAVQHRLGLTDKHPNSNRLETSSLLAKTKVHQPARLRYPAKQRLT